MLKSDMVEVTLVGRMINWYRDKGYDIPMRDVQLYCTKDGKKVKNGTRKRIARGSKIWVRVEDLPPKSNKNIIYICGQCKNEVQTTYQAYQYKLTDKCTNCEKKSLKSTKNGLGSHDWWVRHLIWENPDGKCDISGETDRRFLVLHHLHSRGNGGKNEEKNYVILSYNYHLCFHNSFMGGMNVPCVKEDYERFKEEELNRINEVLK